MLFSSWQFIFLFLPLTVWVFFLIPIRFRLARKTWLIAASLFFYGYWKIEYVPLLLFSIVFNYAVAETISRWHHGALARPVLIVGVSVNLLLLGYYKYTNFILDALGLVASRSFSHFDIILPLAISFFTFTQIGYLVDVYHDRTLHYRFMDYALFVVFFPHLIAGPIVRHWEVIPQFAEKDLRMDRTNFSLGLAQFLMGLYKKLLLADPVAQYANIVYDGAAHGITLTFFDAWLGTVAYALQIYFDFSGYSDMAIGLSRMFGIKFPQNFDSPYRAGSIIDFWRRWHITLTRFLREYLYFPLGGNRCSQTRQGFNILVTMLLSGLWHGAGWTFVIWGGLHGFYLLVTHEWRRFLKWRGWSFTHWSYRGTMVLATFIAVLFSWVFFRSANLPTAKRVLASMTAQQGWTAPESAIEPEKPIGQWLVQRGVRVEQDRLAVPSYPKTLRTIFVLLLIIWFVPNTQQLLMAYEPVLEPVQRMPQWKLKLNLWTGLALGVLFFCVLRGFYVATPSPFIYFNF